MKVTRQDIRQDGVQNPSTVSGGHLVAKALRNEGVDTVFTLSGGNIVDIYDGCVTENIRIIDFRHEQVAAHAADAYGRQLGKTACLITTSGPGCCNAVTGLATALHAETPLIHIGGQGATTQHLKGSLQEFDHVKLMTPVTKWANSVRTGERIADMVSMACREANREVPGPVYLEVPRDLLDAHYDINQCIIPKAGHYRCNSIQCCISHEIDRFLLLLKQASRPVILFGSQVWSSKSHRQSLEFIKAFKIPAYTNGAARGIFPDDEPNALDRSRSYALQHADLVIIVGTPLDFRLDYGNTINHQAKLVEISRDYGLIGRNRDIELGLLGDVGEVLSSAVRAKSEITDNINSSEREDWLSELHQKEKEQLEKILPLLKSETVPINPYRLAYEINKIIEKDTIFIGDGGDVVSISAQAVRTHQPGQWMDPGPFGTLGVGTGFAIGAKLASPKKDVVCYYGDGAFSMTAFDMDTANRFGVPYLAVIGNNSAMNQIRYSQLARYGQRGNTASLLSDLSYGKFAELMGGYGEEVHRPEDIAGALSRGREAVAKTGRCAVINVWVDPQVWAPGTKARLKARMMGQ